MCLVSFSKIESYGALEKVCPSRTPSWCYIEIVNYCSHSCVWCYGDYGKQNHKKSISLADFDLILNKLDLLNIKQITLSGGEPLEHPNFADILGICKNYNFKINLASNGARINQDIVTLLAENGVNQVQINWQGSKHHSNIHNDNLQNVIAGIKLLRKADIQVVTNTTIGVYNIMDLQGVFEEAAALDVDRLRVWEIAGVNGSTIKEEEIINWFNLAKHAASKLGYKYILSYDPLYKGDVSVSCPQRSNVLIFVDVEGNVRNCLSCSKIDKYKLPILNLLNTKLIPDEMLNRYLLNNKYVFSNNIQCLARGR